MKIFKITIWKFTEELYSGEFQFNNADEANTYAMGIAQGIRIMGGETTGFSVNENSEEPVQTEKF